MDGIQFQQAQSMQKTNPEMAQRTVPKAMASSTIDDAKKVITDANEYVARQHFAISLLQPTLFAISQPWLKGYSAQTNSISTGTGGPLSVGFYMARFWIDQNIKNNMGH